VNDVSRETADADAPAVSRETSAPAPPPDILAAVFGPQAPLAIAYADLLATDGVVRGLIGPREAPRLWDRHLLNSAVLGELVPAGATVCDIGSGAGLPGIPLALARPDLQVELVEPLLRRVTFLEQAIQTLGLARVTVTRARAEALSGARADVVTARAVAPLSTLGAWCLPLVRPGGSLLALKGARAEQELAEAEPEFRRLGAISWDVVTCGASRVEPLTTVVRVVAGSTDLQVTRTATARSGVARRRGRKGDR
jgi:16S rRNA (guanine527-N7)-methyltransferase